LLSQAARRAICQPCRAMAAAARAERGKAAAANGFARISRVASVVLSVDSAAGKALARTLRCATYRFVCMLTTLSRQATTGRRETEVHHFLERGYDLLFKDEALAARAAHDLLRLYGRLHQHDRRGELTRGRPSNVDKSCLVVVQEGAVLQGAAAGAYMREVVASRVISVEWFVESARAALAREAVAGTLAGLAGVGSDSTPTNSSGSAAAGGSDGSAASGSSGGSTPSGSSGGSTASGSSGGSTASDSSGGSTASDSTGGSTASDSTVSGSSVANAASGSTVVVSSVSGNSEGSAASSCDGSGTATGPAAAGAAAGLHEDANASEADSTNWDADSAGGAADDSATGSEAGDAAREADGSGESDEEEDAAGVGQKRPLPEVRTPPRKRARRSDEVAAAASDGVGHGAAATAGVALGVGRCQGMGNSQGMGSASSLAAARAPPRQVGRSSAAAAATAAASSAACALAGAVVPAGRPAGASPGARVHVRRGSSSCRDRVVAAPSAAASAAASQSSAASSEAASSEAAPSEDGPAQQATSAHLQLAAAYLGRAAASTDVVPVNTVQSYLTAVREVLAVPSGPGPAPPDGTLATLGYPVVEGRLMALTLTAATRWSRGAVTPSPGFLARVAAAATGAQPIFNNNGGDKAVANDNRRRQSPASVGEADLPGLGALLHAHAAGLAPNALVALASDAGCLATFGLAAI
jgi:hypothetical protein